ncbi:MAG: DUF6152 family protein [Gammaproteobacteria bacterium]
MKKSRQARLLSMLAVTAITSSPAHAHHSFAMYDRSVTYVFTGVVVSINPDPSHLQIVFVPLNEARDALVRDAAGERVVWNVEMESAAASAQEGITASNFARGTVFSVGLTPLRNGDPGGSRVGALFRCPQDNAPAAGMHCDSVEGHTRHGEGELPAPTQSWTP